MAKGVGDWGLRETGFQKTGAGDHVHNPSQVFVTPPHNKYAIPFFVLVGPLVPRIKFRLGVVGDFVIQFYASPFCATPIISNRHHQFQSPLIVIIKFRCNILNYFSRWRVVRFKWTSSTHSTTYYP